MGGLIEGVMFGVLTDCHTSKERRVKCTFKVVPVDGRDAFQLYGGPTGFEGFYMDGSKEATHRTGGWCACEGTKEQWDTLKFSAEEMTHVYDHIAKARRNGNDSR